MAIIKKNEFEQMSEKSLEEKLLDLKKELMKYRSQRYSGTPPENTGRVREVRKTIARIYTKLSQKKETTEKLKTETTEKPKSVKTTKKTMPKGKGVKAKV